MRKLKIDKDYITSVIAVLEDGGPFDVLAKLVHGRETASFVLRGWTWRTFGNLDRAAFCALSVASSGDAELSITHINVPRQWYKVNIFEGFDRRIEDQIRDYIISSVPKTIELEVEEAPRSLISPGAVIKRIAKAYKKWLIGTMEMAKRYLTSTKRKL